MSRTLTVLAVSLVFLPVLLGAGCGEDEPVGKSYLLVKLNIAPALNPVPNAAVVEIDGLTKSAPFCVRLTDTEGELSGSGASFVLSREATSDQSVPVSIVVTGYETLSGWENADTGTLFPCPDPLPPPITDSQELLVSFCGGDARVVEFHVGAWCTVCPGVGGDAGVDARSDVIKWPDGATDVGVDAPGEADAPGDVGPVDTGSDVVIDTVPFDTGSDVRPEVGSETGPDGAVDSGGVDAGTCVCSAGTTCGAGVTTSWQTCPANVCCSSRIVNSCDLLRAAPR